MDFWVWMNTSGATRRVFTFFTSILINAGV